MPQRHELEIKHSHKDNQTLRHTPAIFTAAGKWSVMRLKAQFSDGFLIPAIASCGYSSPMIGGDLHVICKQFDTNQIRSVLPVNLPRASRPASISVLESTIARGKSKAVTATP
jgi:hypothetical protein